MYAYLLAITTMQLHYICIEEVDLIALQPAYPNQTFGVCGVQKRMECFLKTSNQQGFSRTISALLKGSAPNQ